MVLNSLYPFGTVGQLHGGALGFLQERVIQCVDNIWFDRSQQQQKSMVSQRIKEHINDPTMEKLLIFPEGLRMVILLCCLFFVKVFIMIRFSLILSYPFFYCLLNDFLFLLIYSYFFISISLFPSLFPLGTCVNNKYCIMFKKGAFDIGATVVPIAIRYHKTFADPYFNSRKMSFWGYCFRLMRSRLLFADVYFLDPQTQRENETPVEFADRVKV